MPGGSDFARLRIRFLHGSVAASTFVSLMRETTESPGATATTSYFGVLSSMPREIVPLAPFSAIEGVLVPACVIGSARHALAIKREARRRAAHVTESALSGAEAIRRDARRAGYLDGLTVVMSGLARCLAEISTHQSNWKDKTRQQLANAMRASMAEAGVEASVITQTCEMAASPPGATVRLILPERLAALAVVLRARSDLREVCVVVEGDGLPVLDAGQFVHEFDVGSHGDGMDVPEVPSGDLDEAVRALSQQWSTSVARDIWKVFDQRARLGASGRRKL